MGNHWRNEMDTRGERTQDTPASTSSPTNGTSQDWPASGRRDASFADRDPSGRSHEDFYRRADSRGDANRWRTSGPVPMGTATYGHPTAPNYSPVAVRARDPYGRDQRATNSSGYGHRDETRGDRPASGYGDYGHPGEGNRQAYGDMGFGDPHAGSAHVAPVRRDGEPRNETLLARVRRWRQGSRRALDVMTRNPRVARPTDSLQAIAQMMIDEDTGIIPIVEDGQRLVGVVTDRDIVCRLVARGIDMRAAKAADVMTDEVECVTEQHDLHDALRLMSEHQIRRIPVVARGDRLVGIISMADIAREADFDHELQDTFGEISSERAFWSQLR